MNIINLATVDFTGGASEGKTYAYWLVGSTNITNKVKLIKDLREFGTGLKEAKEIADLYINLYNSDPSDTPEISILIYIGSKDISLTEDGTIESSSDKIGIFAKMEVTDTTIYTLQTGKVYVDNVPTSPEYKVYVSPGPQYDYKTSSISGPLAVGLIQIPSQEIKTIDITENGSYDVYPTSTKDNNRFLSRVGIKVDVPTPAFMVPDGMKFQKSYLDSEVINKLDYSDLSECSGVFKDTTIWSSDELGYLGIDVDISFAVVESLADIFRNAVFDTTNEGSNYTADVDIHSPAAEDISYAFAGTTTSKELGAFSVTLTLNQNSDVHNATGLFESSDVSNVNVICSSNRINNWTNAFKGCSNLKSLYLGTDIVADLDLSDCILLESNSIVNVIDHLVSGIGKTLTLGETNLAKLSDEEKAVATDKGWTLA